MGELFNELLAEQQKPKKKTQLDVVVESLSGDDLRDFIQLLEDENVSSTALVRVLTKRGFRIHRQGIHDYRRGTFRYTIEGDS
jgi:hypothetical protein